MIGLFWLNRAVEDQPATVRLLFQAEAERGAADDNLYPEFGRNHLAGRKVAGDRPQRN